MDDAAHEIDKSCMLALEASVLGGAVSVSRASKGAGSLMVGPWRERICCYISWNRGL